MYFKSKRSQKQLPLWNFRFSNHMTSKTCAHKAFKTFGSGWFLSEIYSFLKGFLYIGVWRQLKRFKSKVWLRSFKQLCTWWTMIQMEQERKVKLWLIASRLTNWQSQPLLWVHEQDLYMLSMEICSLTQLLVVWLIYVETAGWNDKFRSTDWAYLQSSEWWIKIIRFLDSSQLQAAIFWNDWS